MDTSVKDKIKNIAEKLEHQIRMHELDLNDRIKDIPQIILLLEQGFSELGLVDIWGDGFAPKLS